MVACLSSRRLFTTLAAVAAAVMLASCTGKDAVASGSNEYRYVGTLSTGELYPSTDRKLAENFTQGLLDGKGSYTLSQDQGKVVVLNFWASWCAPCVVETPQFDLVYRAYKSKGVNFIGVDTKNDRQAAQYFVKDNNISFTNVLDEKGEVAVRLGKIPALGMPFTVLIDKQGGVAGLYLGAMSPRDLEPLLNTLIAEA